MLLDTSDSHHARRYTRARRYAAGRVARFALIALISHRASAQHEHETPPGELDSVRDS